MKTTRAILLCAALVMVAGIATVGQGHRRVKLVQSVVTRGDVVSLADLLPDDAPAQLRVSAARVVVGDSPAPGTRRTFRNSEVESALRGAPQLRAAVEIPSAIEATRWSRLLSRREILGAVNATIPAVLVTEDAPKIEITQFKSSFGDTETEVEAWISSEPRVPPFWVTLRCALNMNFSVANRTLPSADTSAKPRIQRPDENTPAKGSIDPADIIRAGQHVQLVMLSKGMRITTSATALERGRQGQQIRVRSVLGSKLLVVTVMSAQLVEVRY
jgi:flagellar basal body P-ring formation chaperone FlgA